MQFQYYHQKQLLIQNCYYSKTQNLSSELTTSKQTCLRWLRHSFLFSFDKFLENEPLTFSSLTVSYFVRIKNSFCFADSALNLTQDCFTQHLNMNEVEMQNKNQFGVWLGEQYLIDAQIEKEEKHEHVLHNLELRHPPLFEYRHPSSFQKWPGCLQVRANLAQFGIFSVSDLVFHFSYRHLFKKYFENVIKFLVY
ncbi:Hypothetical_protein [Hexamita inflata]|uniref:Hypothetical_protein n=1 Tax=Hexamita inflata TaxID=28002 RepID=A0AA86NWI4_9EUKA|nr:Hypothetical protein HINF_LOCUS14571 [Hexamita inflata]